jgi:hypothetical protein
MRHPANIPRSKLWICWCTDLLQQVMASLPGQIKCVEVAVQVILKCWWLLSTCRSAVRGLVLRTKRDTEIRQFYRLYWEHKTGYCCLSKQAILLKYAEHTYESNGTLLKYLYRWPENSTSLFRKSTEFSITSWQLLQNCNYTHSHEYKNYSLLGYGK